MQNTFKRLALLVIALLSCVCVTLGVAACGDKEEKATYSLTVTTTATDLTLTDIKAQWLSGTDAASDEIALDQDGKASVELVKGDYTVTLKGVPEGYSFQNASVTADNTSATITVTKDAPNPPAPSTKTFTVQVSAPAGETLSADVKVQLYSGDTAVGTAVALTEGRASLTAEDGEYTVKISGLPEYLTYTPATVSGTSTAANITLSYAELTYTVTFDEGNYVGALSGVKAQLWSTGDGAAKVAESDITDGTATFTATAGDYTIKLDGLASGYSINAVSLSKTVKTASVTLKGHEIAVTVVKKGNAASIDFADLNVELKVDDTKKYEATPDEYGEITFAVPAAAYTVELSGLPATHKCDPVTVAADGSAATLEIVAIVDRTTDSDLGYEVTRYNLVGDGKFTGLYLISADSYGSIEYDKPWITISSDRLATYTITWSNTVKFKSFIDPLEFKATSQSDEQVVFMLDKGEKVSFILQSVTGDEPASAGLKVNFNVNVVCTPAGTLDNPLTFEYTQDGYNSYIKPDSYAFNTKNVYFSFLNSATGTYVITPGDGVTVYQVATTGSETPLIASQLLQYHVDIALNSGLRFVSEGDSVSFSIEYFAYEGSGSPSKPIDLTLGETAEFNFTNYAYDDIPVAWFKLTTQTEGYYLVSNIYGVDSIFILSGLDTENGPLYYESEYYVDMFNGTDNTSIVKLDVGTYYFALGYNTLNMQFAVSVFEIGDEQTGTMNQPVTISAAGTVNAITAEDYDKLDWKLVPSPSGYGPGTVNASIDRYYIYTSTSETDVLVYLSDISSALTSGPTGAPTVSVSITNSSLGKATSYSNYSDLWRSAIGSDKGGATVLKQGEKTLIHLSYSLDDYMNGNIDTSKASFTSIGTYSFKLSVVPVETVTTDNETTLSATDAWAVKYYKYTADSDGTLAITFSGADSANVGLTVFADDKGSYRMNEYGQEVFVGSGYQYGAIATHNPVSNYFTTEVETGDVLYFAIDYKASASADIKFNVGMLDLIVNTANNDDNTVSGVADRSSLQIKNYSYTAQQVGFVCITVEEGSSIKAIERLGTNILGEYIAVDPASPLNLAVKILGNTNVKFNIKFYDITEAELGAENAIGEATTTEQRKYFSYTPSETGFYIFSIVGSGITAHVYTTDNVLTTNPILEADSTFVFYVTYKANEGTVSDVKLSIAQPDLATANVGNNSLGTATSNPQTKYFKFTVGADGFYTFTDSGIVSGSATIYVYTADDYDEVEISDANLLRSGEEYVIVVVFSGESGEGKLVITKVEEPAIEGTQADLGKASSTKAQTKIFKFTATEKKGYKFSFDKGNSSFRVARITLYDENYVQLNGATVELDIDEFVIVVVTYQGKSGNMPVKLNVTAYVPTDVEISSAWEEPTRKDLGTISSSSKTFTFTAGMPGGSAILSNYIISIDLIADNDSDKSISTNQLETKTISSDGQGTYTYQAFRSAFTYDGDDEPTILTITITLSDDLVAQYDGLTLSVAVLYETDN